MGCIESVLQSGSLLVSGRALSGRLQYHYEAAQHWMKRLYRLAFLELDEYMLTASTRGSGILNSS